MLLFEEVGGGYIAFGMSILPLFLCARYHDKYLLAGALKLGELTGVGSRSPD